MPKKDVYTLEEATKKLEYFCAYQERCHKEVVQKLQSMNMIPEAIDAIIVHLINHKFLDETRFAKSFVRGKFRIKKWGKNRLERELKQRDISVYNIKQALSEIPDEDYLQALNELAEKQLDRIKESNTWKARKKLSDYLLYRGWESHLVYKKATELIKG